MYLLTAGQIDRVYDVTDSLGLKRLAIIVPLSAAECGSEAVMPDGNLLMRAPYGGRFEPWLEGLRERLLNLALARVPRAGELEPPVLRMAMQALNPGMRRGDGAPAAAGKGPPRRTPPAAPHVPSHSDAPADRVRDQKRVNARRDAGLGRELGGEA